jgi:hypothetical protein
MRVSAKNEARKFLSLSRSCSVELQLQRLVPDASRVDDADVHRIAGEDVTLT